MLAEPSPQHCRKVWLKRPCLLERDLDEITSVGKAKGWHQHRIDVTFPTSEEPEGLERHLNRELRKHIAMPGVCVRTSGL